MTSRPKVNVTEHVMMVPPWKMIGAPFTCYNSQCYVMLARLPWLSIPPASDLISKCINIFLNRKDTKGDVKQTEG
ncbi:hypothetical protein SAMN05421736_108104 [Evansella caseinilytica]|uniref:Uncharacterized protein n=1 Tax=Evansella caseinilytica TaxID=1503961 RepID=A0A1H3RJD7_9BACI|nr:hypothetical protein SAMN05421736_108104 [Evansella caseinilytica]